MTRRDWFQWLMSGSASVVAGDKKEQERCVTPAYAGFDGAFRMNGSYGFQPIIKLARCYVDNPKRWGVATGMLAVWRNRDDSVSKVVYRNRDGKLFSLEFVPLEEPT